MGTEGHGLEKKGSRLKIKRYNIRDAFNTLSPTPNDQVVRAAPTVGRVQVDTHVAVEVAETIARADGR